MTNKKINWEKESKYWKGKSEEWREDYYEQKNNSMDESEAFGLILFFSLASIAIFSIILCLCGVFDTPIAELNLDKDDLVREHVIKYYPEYKDCNIKYNSCINGDYPFCTEGIEIYCDKLDNRDGLKVSTKTEPTEILYFDEITLEDILINKINGEYK